ncbi:hypothetical protein [Jiella pelagia]|uniref:Thermonuclease family protein n=1 Tax=Jiella pelagia TaxID=2986949 RepID=A0ABY7C4H3_9HYPH|nr:hypothetical protein [Jiella pelagia]WAP70646.1 hypothetical protein OH818_11865 [Jiella pelagia]
MRACAYLTLIGCIIALPAAEAGELAYQREIAGPVAANVVKVRDGDTVEVEAFVWPMQSVHVAVRLRGIDAPEKRGKCEAEKAAAARATARLTEPRRRRRGPAQRRFRRQVFRPRSGEAVRRREPGPRADPSEGRARRPLQGRQAPELVRRRRSSQWRTA